jgi:asparagine synthase (glutamine-hydrolysing)
LALGFCAPYAKIAPWNEYLRKCSAVSPSSFAVLDGEIYNAQELRAELASGGTTFTSDCDAELLQALLEEKGFPGLRQVIGKFSFAAVNLEHRKLILARDLFGIKPFYYATQNAIVFASELEPLLEASVLNRTVDPGRALEFLLRGRVGHSGQTLFREVQQLPAGHYVEIDLDLAKMAVPVAYWELPSTVHLSFGDAADRLHDLLVESATLCVPAETRAGATLSGGIDSSAVVAVMREVQGSGQDLHVFNFVGGGDDGDPAKNESPWAELVQREMGAIMHPIRILPQQISGEFDEVVLVHDEPLGSPVVYPHLEICRMAKRLGITRVMSGHGADLMFGGGDSHIAARILTLLRAGRWIAAQSLARHAVELPELGWKHLARRTTALALPFSVRETLRNLTGQNRVPRWLNRHWFESRGVVRQAIPERNDDSMIALRREQLLTTLLPTTLRIEERNTAFCTIQSCFPFLTPPLAEFAFSLPEEFLVGNDATTKPILRQAMRGRLPDRTLDRKDRLGFPIPAVSWLTTLRTWADERLKETCDLPLIDPDHIRVTWKRFCSSEDESPRTAFLIWRWIFLGGWVRQHHVTFD